MTKRHEQPAPPDDETISFDEVASGFDDEDARAMTAVTAAGGDEREEAAPAEVISGNQWHSMAIRSDKWR